MSDKCKKNPWPDGREKIATSFFLTWMICMKGKFRMVVMWPVDQGNEKRPLNLG